jgi:hypothetical protein
MALQFGGDQTKGLITGISIPMVKPLTINLVSQSQPGLTDHPIIII